RALQLYDAGGNGLQVVMRQFRQVRLRIPCIERLERLRDTALELSAPTGRQLVIQRVADQRVPEPQASRRARKLRDHPRRRRLVEAIEKRVPAAAAHRLE